MSAKNVWTFYNALDATTFFPVREILYLYRVTWFV